MTLIDAPQDSYAGGPLVVTEGAAASPADAEQLRVIEIGQTDGDEASKRIAVLQRLFALIQSPNIAKDLKKDILGQLGSKVCRETAIDERSREKWKRRTEAGMKLAMQEAEAKTYPWPNAANVKFPLMTTAAIQFAARAYPAIIAGKNVVKVQIEGSDPQGKKRARGDRVGQHMSWQLLTEMPEWEPDVDRMLHALPIMGCAFKKTFHDPAKGRNCSPYVSAFDLIVNYHAKSLETAPRVTHEFPLYPYEIEERIRTGVFIDVELGIAQGGGDDPDHPHMFYEQHRREDLDEDGYAEPYIVTVHKDTQQVVRVKACFTDKDVRVGRDGKILRIDPKQYFTKIPFIPNPDGGFYDVGFGWLLSPLNEAVNTVLNQLLDAGHLANTGGGFIGNGLRLTGGSMRFIPGEFKEVDANGATVKENVVPLTFPGPNAVLFQLLGMLVEAGREVAAVKDVLTGEQPAANTPATTTLALIEQGLKVFTAIYKRIHRGLKDEFAKLYKLNAEHFDEEGYLLFHDMAPDVVKGDYEGDPGGIVPVSDPTIVSDMQRLAKAEFLKGYMDLPFVNGEAIVRRTWDAAGIENQDELIKKDQGPPPELMAKLAELTANVQKIYSEILKNQTQAVKNIADAEAAEAGAQIQQYVAVTSALKQGSSNEQPGPNDQGAVAPPGEQPGMEGPLPIPPGQPGLPGGDGQAPMAGGLV